MKVFEEYRASICDNAGLVFVPDNFQAKLHQFPPQLVVGLGEVIGNGVSRTKWTFTIPHYRHKNPSPAPRIPRLRKGNYWARFVLTDNSRVYVNAISAIEGENFIKDIIPLIDPAFLPPEQPYKIDTGKRGGNPIREVNTEPTYGMYYKKPLKDSQTGKFDPRLKPEWTVKVEVAAG